MDTSTPFKLSLSVSFWLINDASVTYYGVVGEDGWDYSQDGRLDNEDRIVIGRMLDRYEIEIRKRAGRVTVAEIAQSDGSIVLLSATRKRPFEISMVATLDIIEED
jgi:hypothetical protein